MLNIDELIKEALLCKNKVRLNAFKNLKNEILKYKTAKNAKPYNDATEITIFSKYAKSLEDAISQFSEAHRDDLVSEYTAELEEVKKLLPEPVSSSDIVNFILSDEFFDNYKIDENAPVIPKKEMGACIKYVKSKFPTAEGKDVSNIIKSMVI